MKNPITLATISNWNLCGRFLLGAWIGKYHGAVTRGEELYHTSRLYIARIRKLRGAVTRGEEPHYTGRFYIALYFVIFLTTTNLNIISHTLYCNQDDQYIL